ncbi:MAG: DUF167 domain-containing protein [Candidatus Dojkabacteria bacterium]|jgi:uncharacterized protein YggU (UPF0235/DUF167 family)|nr:DUF167 domain-containing protein [Candidatus Dojkabacteria bacterium]MDD2270058.1 DUF167 domain-containing protein [Candidatus Dojkabacteria bacterium]
MMKNKIKVKVKIGTKRESVEYKDGIYTVYTNSPARDNKANISVIEQLSKYLDIPKSSMQIKSGIKSKNKVIAY